MKDLKKDISQENEKNKEDSLNVYEADREEKENELKKLIEENSKLDKEIAEHELSKEVEIEEK